MRIICSRCALAVRMGSKDQRHSRVDIFHQGYAGPLEALPRASTFLEEQDRSLVALRRQAIKMATKTHSVSETTSCYALIDWISFLLKKRLFRLPFHRVVRCPSSNFWHFMGTTCLIRSWNNNRSQMSWQLVCLK